MKCSQSCFALERNNAIISLFSAVIPGLIGKMAKINWGLSLLNSPSLSQRAMLSLTYVVYQMFLKDLFAPAAILFHFLLQLSSLNNLMSMKNDANLTNPVFRIFLPELPSREAPRRWLYSLLGQWEPSAPLSRGSAGLEASLWNCMIFLLVSSFVACL